MKKMARDQKGGRRVSRFMRAGILRRNAAGGENISSTHRCDPEWDVFLKNLPKKKRLPTAFHGAGPKMLKTMFDISRGNGQPARVKKY